MVGSALPPGGLAAAIAPVAVPGSRSLGAIFVCSGAAESSTAAQTRGPSVSLHFLSLPQRRGHRFKI